MIITKEISLSEFEPWSGAVSTFDRIYDEGKMDDLEYTLEELYPNGIDETHLNDLFWFEEDWLYDILGISDEDEDDEDDLDESVKLKEEISDEVYTCAEQIADEIEQVGVMHFTDIQDRVINCLGLSDDDRNLDDFFTDVYVLLGYMGIDQNYSSGDFFTREYAKEHPEVLEENKKSSKRRNRRSKKVTEARYTGSIYTDEEFQDEVDSFLNNYDLEATNINTDEDGVSVYVKDKTSGVGFWFDLWIDSYGDLTGDWNDYIFRTDDFNEALRSEIQDNAFFFEEVMEKAEDYAMNKGVLNWNSETDSYEITDTGEFDISRF